jgi:hypothetical protein
LIFETLKFYEEAYRQDINVKSITHAIGWSGLFNGFAGKDSKQIKPEDIVPFPDLMNQGTEKTVFSSKTRSIVYRLLKDKRIPPAVAAFLQTIPEIRERYIKDG